MRGEELRAALEDVTKSANDLRAAVESCCVAAEAAQRREEELWRRIEKLEKMLRGK